MNDLLLTRVPVQPLVDLIQAYTGIFTCLGNRMLAVCPGGCPLRIWMELAPDEPPNSNKKQCVHREDTSVVPVDPGRSLGQDRSHSTGNRTDGSRKRVVPDSTSTDGIRDVDWPRLDWRLRPVYKSGMDIRFDLYWDRSTGIIGATFNPTYINTDILDCDLAMDGYDDLCRRLCIAPMHLGKMSVVMQIDSVTRDYLLSLVPRTKMWEVRFLLHDIAGDNVGRTGRTAKIERSFQTNEEAEVAHPDVFKMALVQMPELNIFLKDYTNYA